jgi:hypothetical protein
MSKSNNLTLLATIVVLTSLSVAFVESVTYYGFLYKHTHIPSALIYLLSILIVLFSRSNLPHSKRLDAIAKYKTLVIVSSLIILSIVEALTFPNFVFANIHLNLLSYPMFVFLALCLYQIYSNKAKSNMLVLSQMLMMLGLGLYLHLNVPKVVTGIYHGIGEIIAHPTATYDQKMERSYGDFYLAMKMVQELTPDDAVIAIPPQENPWLSEGNGALVQYFIYPRKLTHVNTEEAELVPTHFLIARGSWNSDDKSKYGWPKEVIKASRVWELAQDGSTIQYDRDYDPSTDKWNWGLIEVAQ